jgi:hypothetical protein
MNRIDEAQDAVNEPPRHAMTLEWHSGQADWLGFSVTTGSDAG